MQLPAHLAILVARTVHVGRPPPAAGILRGKARWTVPVALAAALACALPAHADTYIGLTRPVPQGTPTKACIAAGVKLKREQQSLDGARADLDRYIKARASCITKSACARNDDRIASLEKRIPRNVARINTFRANQDAACKGR